MHEQNKSLAAAFNRIFSSLHFRHDRHNHHGYPEFDNDPGGLGEVGDLRYALSTLNQNLNTTPDDYAIVFASPMTIQLNGILPVINNSSNPVNITIGNPGATPTVTIDGNSGAYSGFFIPIRNATIQNMTFQNLAAKGGNGGNGISGGGGGMGAGGAIYAPQFFLRLEPFDHADERVHQQQHGRWRKWWKLLGSSLTGNEGGGGASGFSGNGGSIVTTGQTGGGGLGSRATIGTLSNLGIGGSDQSVGLGAGTNGIPGQGASPVIVWLQR